MARIRSVKPEFWTDGKMIGLSPWARLLYIGAWNFACDGGHLDDDPMSLKLRVLPADQVDPFVIVAELLDAGRVVRRRTTGGRSYLAIPRFTDHQKVDPRWKSRCPYCLAEQEGSVTDEPSPEHAASPANSAEAHPNSPEFGGDSPTLPEPRHGVEWSGVDKNKTSSCSAPPEADAVPPKREKARGSRIPEPFTVTEEMRLWAKEHVPHLAGRGETEKFIDYWRAASGQKAVKRDWVAAWRFWMRGAAERLPRGSPGNVIDLRDRQPRPSTADLRVADAMALAQRLSAEEDSHDAG